MRTLIVTSSYPSIGRATDGVFVKEFARCLKDPVYVLSPGRNMPWLGGNKALASLNLANPINWFIALHFLVFGCIATVRACRRLKITRVLCFWAIPSGIFGVAAMLFAGVPFDTYSLGSDVWKFKKSGAARFLLRRILRLARRRYADGFSLVHDVEAISGKPCQFLPLGRQLPYPNAGAYFPSRQKKFLYVGRYHHNKGPDQLISAIRGMFKAQRNEFRVYMFGFGEMGGNLHKQVGEAGLDEVILIGEEISAQSLSNWLAFADYLVIPSRIDSIPVVATDAVRANCPIIAMPVGDLPWMIEKFRCGILAEKASPEGLRHAMLKAIYSTDRDSLVTGCRAAAKLFDVQGSALVWEAGW